MSQSSRLGRIIEAARYLYREPTNEEARRQLADLIEYKYCNKCSTKKSIIEFGVLESSPDGYRNTCKECRTQEHLNRKKRNRGKKKSTS